MDKLRAMNRLNLMLWVTVGGLMVSCEPGKVRQLEQQNARLEQRVAKLEQRVAKLEQRGAAKGGAGPLGGLLGQLLQGAPGARRPTVGRAQPMDPELQRRLDRLMVDGLEKLSQNDEARGAVKAMLKAITAGMQHGAGSGGAGSGGLPPSVPILPQNAPPPSPAAGPCAAQEQTLSLALQRAGRCRQDTDCTVLRTSVCGWEGLSCYAALVNKDDQQAARDALGTFTATCTSRKRCRCRTPTTARCSAGRCVAGR